MSAPLAAVTAPAVAPASTAGAIGGSLLALIAVIALILMLAWLLRRLPGAAMGSHGGMKVVASLAVGMKERVMVVQVGEQQLAIGVTAQQVTLLKTLDTPLPVDTTRPDFAGVLARFKQGSAR
jgi:flagellar protein FliO/FliZ